MKLCTTGEPRHTTTPLIRPPRYCDLFFVVRTKAHSFSYLKTPLIRQPRYYDQRPPLGVLSRYYFGGARSKGFATLRNVSKLPFFDKIGQAKSVGFRFYLANWRSGSRISSRYLEITSISLIYSLPFSRKKELLFWLSRGLNRLTWVTCQIRGDSKLRD